MATHHSKYGSSKCGNMATQTGVQFVNVLFFLAHRKSSDGWPEALSGENLSFRFWNEFKCCHPPPPCSPPRDVPPVARCLTATPPQRSGCPAVPTSLMWRLLLVTFLAGLTHSEPTEEPGALPVPQCSPPPSCHIAEAGIFVEVKKVGHPSSATLHYNQRVQHATSFHCFLMYPVSVCPTPFFS